jgi:hypothetical protein
LKFWVSATQAAVLNPDLISFVPPANSFNDFRSTSVSVCAVCCVCALCVLCVCFVALQTTSLLSVIVSGCVCLFVCVVCALCASHTQFNPHTHTVHEFAQRHSARSLLLGCFFDVLSAGYLLETHSDRPPTTVYLVLRHHTYIAWAPNWSSLPRFLRKQRWNFFRADYFVCFFAVFSNFFSKVLKETLSSSNTLSKTSTRNAQRTTPFFV